ncbi:MAG: hypothetical protein OYK82_08855 [Gammaproteobacteria bacterium]|nr:hypothetical protein [Gammaproteobacteria bacterium]
MRGRTLAAGVLVLAALLSSSVPALAQAPELDIGANADGMGDASGMEGDTVSLTVKMSASSTSAVTVKWRYVSGGTAEAADYSHDGGQSLTFSPGETSKTVSIDLINDDRHEEQESFEVELYDASGATIDRSRATITIRVDPDNPDLPTFDIQPTLTVEEDAGSLAVTVSHDAFASDVADVTIAYEMVGISAAAGVDFTAASGALTFPMGSRAVRTLDIPILDDALAEEDETFEVRFGAPSIGSINQSPAKTIVTIVDDEPNATGKPAITGAPLVGDTLIAEQGTIDDDDGLPSFPGGFTFQWVRVDASNNETNITGATSRDYTLAAADEGHTIKVKVSFTDDGGGAEELTSDAWPSSGVVTALPALSFASADFNVDEDAGSAVLTVNLEPASAHTVTVDFATRNFGAIAGEDYVAVSGTLTFAPGETSKTITVPVMDNDVYGSNSHEAFFVDLSDASGAALPQPPTTRVWIADDEAAPTASIGNVTVGEGAGAMTITLALSHPSEEATRYFTSIEDVEGTATSMDDYELFQQDLIVSIHVPAGELSVTLDIAIIDDAVVEADETLVINWRKAQNTNATPQDIAFTGTIIDNDAPNATGKPTIEGNARVGDTLIAEQGTIDDDDGAPSFPGGFTFQWVRVSGGTESDITGATSRDYTLVSADEGATIQVEVSFTDNEGNAEGPLASDATAPVAAMPPDGCAPDDLQLIGGSHKRQGSLLICHNNEWRHVCDDLWENVDARVACRQLGYSGGTATIHSEFVSLIDVEFWLDDVACTGGESKLADCGHAGWGESNCRFSERAGVRCGSVRNATGKPTISGAPNVGETLTANKGDIDDDDGTPATFPDDYAFQWIRVDTASNETDIPGATSATYTLAAADLGHTIKVKVSYRDDLDNDETRTSDAYPPSGALTTNLLIATLEAREPVEKRDGSRRHSFDLILTKFVDKSFKDVRDHVFTVTNGAITRAKRISRERRWSNGKFRWFSDHWRMEVRPTVPGEEVTVSMTAEQACGSPGGLCDADGAPLVNAPSLTLPGLSEYPSISIADASTREGGWLRFPVTVSFPSLRYYVVYDFETLDTGTATPGADYTIRPKHSNWLHKGQEVDKPFVKTFNDAVNDRGETVKVRISNARLEDGDGNVIATLTITRAEATGKIRNSGAMPRAWLARFGRTAAGQVADALGERLRGASPGVTLGGRSLAPGAQTKDILAGAAAAGRALNERTGEDSDAPWRELEMSGVLLASSFHLASADNVDSGGRWSVWGRGARSSFEGAEEALTLAGDVTTAVLGLDFERKNWLVGMALARSSGDGSFRAGGICETGCTGEVESALTGLYPYARYKASERFSLWGVLGHGQGDLTLSPEGAGETETGVEMNMAAAGARGVVLPASGKGDFELALRADLLMTQTSSDAAAGLAGTEAETSRIRLLVEGSRALRFGEGGVLTPSVELGLRYEGGDAETGGGLEVGGSVRYASGRFAVALSARGLIAHAESDYEEWGLSGSVRYAPGDEERGLSVSLATAWGADSGGAERLWRERPWPASSGDFDPAARLDAEVAYGLDAARGLLTPYAGLSYSQNIEVWRAGARWRLGPAYEVSLEASFAEPAGDEETESGVLLRGARRW